jgi:hypothetical protein
MQLHRAYIEKGEEEFIQIREEKEETREWRATLGGTSSK